MQYPPTEGVATTAEKEQKSKVGVVLDWIMSVMHRRGGQLIFLAKKETFIHSCHSSLFFRSKLLEKP